MLVSFAVGDTNFLRHLTQNPQRESVEYRLRGYQMQNLRIGHVHFMLSVSISFVLGSQRKPSFQWNMGLKVLLFGSLSTILVINSGSLSD